MIKISYSFSKNFLTFKIFSFDFNDARAILERNARVFELTIEIQRTVLDENSKELVLNPRVFVA